MYSSSKLVSWQMAANSAGLIIASIWTSLRFITIGLSRVRNAGSESSWPPNGDLSAYATLRLMSHLTQKGTFPYTLDIFIMTVTTLAIAVVL
jgi:hypothetical protein